MDYRKYFPTRPPFTSEPFEENDFFAKSIFRTRWFRRNSVGGLGALFLATFVIALYWSVLGSDGPNLAIAVRTLLLCSLFNLILAWIRGILDHRRMRAILSQRRLENTSNEALNFAAGQINGGMWSAFSTALFLFLVILLLLGHYQKRPSEMQLREGAAPRLHHSGPEARSQPR